jgi:hypothetical protein
MLYTRADTIALAIKQHGAQLRAVLLILSVGAAFGLYNWLLIISISVRSRATINRLTVPGSTPGTESGVSVPRGLCLVRLIRVVVIPIAIAVVG